MVYCSGKFNHIIRLFELEVPDFQLFDCTMLYKDTLTFSAKDLLDQIEDKTKTKPTIVYNVETFIVSNSANFSGQLAKLLIVREPLNPLFFFFYSKKIFRQFKEQFEIRILNSQNTIEL